jgi:methyl-accepting chemotaxis protein
MAFMHNLKIGTRLSLAFGVMVLVMLAIVLVAKLGLNNIGDALSLMNADRYPKVQVSNDMIDAVNVQARSTRNLLLMDSLADRERELKSIAEARAKVAKLFEQLEPLVRSDEDKALFKQIQAGRTEYLRELDPFLELVRGGQTDQAREQLLTKLRVQQLQYMQALDLFIRRQEKLMEEAGTHATASIERTGLLMLGAAALGALLAALAGWVVTRSVTQPVQQSVRALQRLAAGDLSMQAHQHRGDELGQLLSGIDSTVQALRQVVGDVRSGVDSVTTASSEIAAGNTDLSGRTEQQAASLQETASSMEQLTSTVKASADNARQANQLAAAASTAAERGGAAVGAVVATMERISESSRRIAEIIGVIDGIAFQTNILALNAAVEAARAGEQGRGFAVVASEVRSLAQRSAEAAKEIKTLISQSAERVDEGSRQVADAGTTITDVVQQVRKVTDLIGEISSAAVEQSSGISQVNTAVSQMDQVTQQNAALVEESAAAAHSLEQQAQRLAQAVAVFKLGAESGAHAVA